MALGPGRDWLCLLLPVLGWGRVLCPSPPVYTLGRLGKLGHRDGLESDPLLGQLLGFLGAGSLCQQRWSCPCAPGSRCTPSDSSSPWFPLGVPSQDTSCPALLILNTRRCKSHLTSSFRNCDLFSELLTSVRDRNAFPSSALFQITVCWKRLGHSLCFCWGVKRRNSLHVIVKLKVQNVLFLLISNIKLVL